MNKELKILVGIDYSETSSNAARYAIHFSKVFNSTLTFFHAYDPPLPPPRLAINYGDMHRIFAGDAIERLKDYGNELLNEIDPEKELNVEYNVDEDTNAGKSIRTFSEKMGIDFVFLGTHGESGVYEKLFGSHAWQVIRDLRTPVFAIPGNAVYTGLKHIAFATEFREGEQDVLKFLTQLAKGFHSKISLIHFCKEDKEEFRDNEILDRFKKEIEANSGDDGANIHMIRSTDIVDSLNAFGGAHQVDCFVMTHMEKMFIEKIINPKHSATKEMTYKTKVPLLAIPDYYNPDIRIFWKLLDEVP
jgi:nucleotide-binding universal stress UspA family protein